MVNPNPSAPFTMVTVRSSAPCAVATPAFPEEAMDTLSSWGVSADADPAKSHPDVCPRGGGLRPEPEPAEAAGSLATDTPAAAAVHHQGAVLHADGCQGGARCCAAGVLWVKGQGVASTEHQGHALTNGNRLEKLDHVGVRAAGPSGITLFTCRNSSGSSPPMIVKPNPMLLFCRAVDRKFPFSWVGSLVNRGFSEGTEGF
ncbi:hypothetical protein F7725_022733 [Dissostichus mawsoni]|uniref:Uncharacterized protein n=1 Tax=Dissostichus mawsoni TaxID=36200 RepID=A0A7J5Z2Y0_DISMA|nr:hypothetical protein F7725_022733 [Dissostichus mawsoni]